MNNKGVSAVSIVTDKAKILFEAISDKLIYRCEHYENFLPWQSWKKVHYPKLELRKTLLKQLSNENITLQESINTIRRQQGLKRKLSRYGKFIVHAMPIHIEKCIRWLFYNIH